MSKAVFPTYWQWVVEKEEAGSSLRYFLHKNASLSEKDAIEFIAFGSVHVNGKKAFNPEKIVKPGDSVRIYWPWHGVKKFYEINEERIIYEDNHIIAYNKEPGIPCQQTPSDSYNNVFSALKRWFQANRQDNPYIAMHHRLDQDTSGVILFSKDKGINKKLSEDFKHKRITKKYLLWAQGKLPASEWVANQKIIRQHHRYSWTDEAKGKEAETFFKVLASFGNRHFIMAIPKTGRTHQIRLHIKASNMEIFGDKIYGGPPSKLLLLHAWELSFSHPTTKKPIPITAPLPPDWPPESFDILQNYC